MKECKRLSLDKSPESWSVWNSSLIFKQLLVEKITQRLTKIPKPVAFGSAMQDYLVLEPADKQEMFPKNKLRQRPVIWMSEMEKITCNDIHGDLPLAIKTSGIMMEISTLHLCVLESTSARGVISRHGVSRRFRACGMGLQLSPFKGGTFGQTLDEAFGG